jgi:hypothetical protein
MLRLSAFILVGLAVAARAEPPSEANDAINADLKKAQAALDLHNTSAVLDAMFDAEKYLKSADTESLQALIAFQKRFRESLTETAEHAALSAASPLTPVEPAPAIPPSPPRFFPKPIPAPPPPDLSLGSEIDVSGAHQSVRQPTPDSEKKTGLRLVPPVPKQPTETASPMPRLQQAEVKTQSQRTIPSVSRLAVGAKLLPYPNHIETVVTSSRSTPAVDIAKFPKESRPQQADLSGIISGQSGTILGVNSRSNRKFLGYYAQDEHDNWIWLPAGSKDCPPPPEVHRSVTIASEFYSRFGAPLFR